ncbi:hypothetical protein [Marisediminicola sp. LYQ85]|uniref:hypothetical protein n=1 Tax=Marisediminicola sp. LYQ85 TaxID=3391062 RepID=UPI0039830D83
MPDFTPATPITPFHDILNNWRVRTYKPATLNELVSATAGKLAGDLAVVLEGGALFEYNGSIWQQKTIAQFTGVTTASSAYSKASGAYRLAGTRIRVGVDEYRWTGAVWELEPRGSSIFYFQGTQSVPVSTSPATRLLLNNTASLTGEATMQYQGNVAIQTGAAGQYLLEGSVTFAPNSTRLRWVEIRRGASESLMVNAEPAGSNSFEKVVSLRAVRTLAAGDVLSIHLAQNSDNPLNVVDGDLQLTRIG